MTTEFKMPEPSVIRSGYRDYRYDLRLYNSPDMRAVIEQCANICNYERVNIFGQSREGSLASCEERIRKLLEQVK